jgi:hypothetical protein
VRFVEERGEALFASPLPSDVGGTVLVIIKLKDYITIYRVHNVCRLSNKGEILVVTTSRTILLNKECITTSAGGRIRVIISLLCCMIMIIRLGADEMLGKLLPQWWCTKAYGA